MTTTLAENANAGRLPGGRVNKLTDAPKVRRSPRDVNATYGPPELCGWQVEAGVFWIQTTDPQFSRKLETRHDMRRVEMVGVNPFRRTFETRGRWRKIRRIIDRFLMTAGGHFFGSLLPKATAKRGRSVSVPGSSNRANNAVLLTGGGQ
jgi:hypothetical protein